MPYDRMCRQNALYTHAGFQMCSSLLDITQATHSVVAANNNHHTSLQGTEDDQRYDDNNPLYGHSINISIDPYCMQRGGIAN